MINCAVIELNTDCNNSCIWCYKRDSLDSHQEMSIGTFESILSVLSEAKCVNIALTGGEPTMHPLLPIFVKKAREYRVERIAIISNGSGYTDEFLGAIEKYRQYVLLNVSLHGATAATHDTITGRAGSYNLLLSSVQRAIMRGFIVCAQMTLCSANRDELSQTLEQLNALHIRNLLINYCRKPINSMFRTNDFLSVKTFSKVVANGIDSYCGNIAIEVGPPLPLCELTPTFKTLMNAGKLRLKIGCGMMDNQLVIDTGGNLLLCSHLSGITIGNINTIVNAHEFFKDINQRIKRQFQRYPWEKCYNCDERKICTMGGCPLLRL